MGINMTNPATRKGVSAISGYYALCLELKGIKHRGPSVLKRMQQDDMGFTAKRKGPMVCEIYTWLASTGNEPIRVCPHCEGVNHAQSRITFDGAART